MKQSSVEWLIGEILKHEMTFFGTASIPLYIIEHAKAMHKTEHFNTWWHGISENEPITFEEYYNETFGGEQ